MSWHHLCTLHIPNQAQSHNVAKKGNKALPSDNKILHFNTIEIFIKFCRIVTIFLNFYYVRSDTCMLLEMKKRYKSQEVVYKVKASKYPNKDIESRINSW